MNKIKCNGQQSKKILQNSLKLIMFALLFVFIFGMSFALTTDIGFVGDSPLLNTNTKNLAKAEVIGPVYGPNVQKLTENATQVVFEKEQIPMATNLTNGIIKESGESSNIYFNSDANNGNIQYQCIAPSEVLNMYVTEAGKGLMHFKTQGKGKKDPTYYYIGVVKIKSNLIYQQLSKNFNAKLFINSKYNKYEKNMASFYWNFEQSTSAIGVESFREKYGIKDEYKDFGNESSYNLNKSIDLQGSNFVKQGDDYYTYISICYKYWNGESGSSLNPRYVDSKISDLKFKVELTNTKYDSGKPRAVKDYDKVIINNQKTKIEDYKDFYTNDYEKYIKNSFDSTVIKTDYLETAGIYTYKDYTNYTTEERLSSINMLSYTNNSSKSCQFLIFDYKKYSRFVNDNTIQSSGETRGGPSEWASSLDKIKIGTYELNLGVKGEKLFYSAGDTVNPAGKMYCVTHFDKSKVAIKLEFYKNGKYTFNYCDKNNSSNSLTVNVKGIYNYTNNKLAQKPGLNPTIDEAYIKNTNKLANDNSLLSNFDFSNLNWFFKQNKNDIVLAHLDGANAVTELGEDHAPMIYYIAWAYSQDRNFSEEELIKIRSPFGKNDLDEFNVEVVSYNNLNLLKKKFNKSGYYYFNMFAQDLSGNVSDVSDVYAIKVDLSSADFEVGSKYIETKPENISDKNDFNNIVLRDVDYTGDWYTGRNGENGILTRIKFLSRFVDENYVAGVDENLSGLSFSYEANENTYIIKIDNGSISDVVINSKSILNVDQSNKYYYDENFNNNGIYTDGNFQITYINGYLNFLFGIEKIVETNLYRNLNIENVSFNNCVGDKAIAEIDEINLFNYSTPLINYNAKVDRNNPFDIIYEDIRDNFDSTSILDGQGLGFNDQNKKWLTEWFFNFSSLYNDKNDEFFGFGTKLHVLISNNITPYEGNINSLVQKFNDNYIIENKYLFNMVIDGNTYQAKTFDIGEDDLADGVKIDLPKVIGLNNIYYWIEDQAGNTNNIQVMQCFTDGNDYTDAYSFKEDSDCSDFFSSYTKKRLNVEKLINDESGKTLKRGDIITLNFVMLHDFIPFQLKQLIEEYQIVVAQNETIDSKWSNVENDSDLYFVSSDGLTITIKVDDRTNSYNITDKLKNKIFTYSYRQLVNLNYDTFDQEFDGEKHSINYIVSSDYADYDEIFPTSNIDVMANGNALDNGAFVSQYKILLDDNSGQFTLELPIGNNDTNSSYAVKSKINGTYFVSNEIETSDKNYTIFTEEEYQKFIFKDDISVVKIYDGNPAIQEQILFIKGSNNYENFEFIEGKNSNNLIFNKFSNVNVGTYNLALKFSFTSDKVFKSSDFVTVEKEGNKYIVTAQINNAKINQKELVYDDFEISLAEKRYDGKSETSLTITAKDNILMGNDEVDDLAFYYDANYVSDDNKYNAGQNYTVQVINFGFESLNYKYAENQTTEFTFDKAEILKANLGLELNFERLRDYDSTKNAKFSYDFSPRFVNIDSSYGNSIVLFENIVFNNGTMEMTDKNVQVDADNNVLWHDVSFDNCSISTRSLSSEALQNYIFSYYVFQDATRNYNYNKLTDENGNEKVVDFVLEKDIAIDNSMSFTAKNVAPLNKYTLSIDNSFVEVVDKTYDGTPDANAKISEEYNRFINADDASKLPFNVIAYFENINVGQRNVFVKVDGFDVENVNYDANLANNYDVKFIKGEPKIATINKKEIFIKNVELDSKIYNGKTNVDISDIQFEGFVENDLDKVNRFIFKKDAYAMYVDKNAGTSKLLSLNNIYFDDKVNGKRSNYLLTEKVVKTFETEIDINNFDAENVVLNGRKPIKIEKTEIENQYNLYYELLSINSETIINLNEYTSDGNSNLDIYNNYLEINRSAISKKEVKFSSKIIDSIDGEFKNNESFGYKFFNNELNLILRNHNLSDIIENKVENVHIETRNNGCVFYIYIVDATNVENPVESKFLEIKLKGLIVDDQNNVDVNLVGAKYLNKNVEDRNSIEIDLQVSGDARNNYSAINMELESEKNYWSNVDYVLGKIAPAQLKIALQNKIVEYGNSNRNFNFTFSCEGISALNDTLKKEIFFENGKLVLKTYSRESIADEFVLDENVEVIDLESNITLPKVSSPNKFANVGIYELSMDLGTCNAKNFKFISDKKVNPFDDNLNNLDENEVLYDYANVDALLEIIKVNIYAHLEKDATAPDGYHYFAYYKDEIPNLIWSFSTDASKLNNLGLKNGDNPYFVSDILTIPNAVFVDSKDNEISKCPKAGEYYLKINTEQNELVSKNYRMFYADGVTNKNTIKLKVGKLPIQGIIFNDQNFVYNGSEFEFNLGNDDQSFSSVNFEFRLNEKDGKIINKIVNVGTYYVTAIIEKENYETARKTIKVIVQPKVVNIIVHGKCFPYDGERHGIDLSKDVEIEKDNLNKDIVNKNDIVITYVDSDGNESKSKPKNVGSYKIVATYPGGGNYAKSKSSSNVNLLIEPIEIFVQVDKYKFVKNDEDDYQEFSIEPKLSFVNSLYIEMEEDLPEVEVVYKLIDYDEEYDFIDDYGTYKFYVNLYNGNNNYLLTGDVQGDLYVGRSVLTSEDEMVSIKSLNKQSVIFNEANIEYYRMSDFDDETKQNYLTMQNYLEGSLMKKNNFKRISSMIDLTMVLNKNDQDLRINPIGKVELSFVRPDGFKKGDLLYVVDEQGNLEELSYTVNGNYIVTQTDKLGVLITVKDLSYLIAIAAVLGVVFVLLIFGLIGGVVAKQRKSSWIVVIDVDSSGNNTEIYFKEYLKRVKEEGKEIAKEIKKLKKDFNDGTISEMPVIERKLPRGLKPMKPLLDLDQTVNNEIFKVEKNLEKAKAKELKAVNDKCKKLSLTEDEMNSKVNEVESKYNSLLNTEKDKARDLATKNFEKAKKVSEKQFAKNEKTRLAKIEKEKKAAEKLSKSIETQKSKNEQKSKNDSEKAQKKEAEKLEKEQKKEAEKLEKAKLEEAKKIEEQKKAEAERIEKEKAEAEKNKAIENAQNEVSNNEE